MHGKTVQDVQVKCSEVRIVDISVVACICWSNAGGHVMTEELRRLGLDGRD